MVSFCSAGCVRDSFTTSVVGVLLYCAVLTSVDDNEPLPFGEGGLILVQTPHHHPAPDQHRDYRRHGSLTPGPRVCLVIASRRLPDYTSSPANTAKRG